ncbi:hypothetical protein NM208_g3714 [Fusarium decemcellulare]|uniref:Uncharacterized protein n=1 Tax=Fusarium decemcellulare TaxID=57161 RepID=A0ACC1SNJ3_9HYPO|nr:hypothetical protein NM208_g3714 [Fusarium decemcellulare]
MPIDEDMPLATDMSLVLDTAISQPSDMQLYPTESPPHLSQTTDTLEDLVARAEYCASLMSSQSASLAQNGFNVFIHPSQTLASNALRDAFAGSALHSRRNPCNATFVDSEIARRASQVVEAMQLALTHSDLVEVDALPPVQALLVYQCIRLFLPANISQQTQAERDNVVLRSWAARLRSSLPPYSRSTLATTTWESWVKQEAIRRTLVCIELVNGTYTYLRGLWPIGVRCHHDLEFTAQKYLWEAKSAAEWRLVCNDARCPSLPASMLRFGEDLQDASPNDLDDMGVLLRVASEGFGKLDEWLGSDRQALQRWSLKGHVRL